MRLHRALLVLLALLASSASAQDAVGTAFGNWNRDGDGVLTPSELDAPRLFALLDLDGDERVTLREARAFYAGSAGARTDAVRAQRDIAYAAMEGVDPKLLSLDLYAPRTGGPHPVLVMIHGGGWRAGDKGAAGMTQHKVPHFVGAGFVYVSINYRLSPAVRHPAHVQDVARALAWVHDRVGEYGGDPGRIFLMGHSAGAHLAALVATDGRYLEAGRKPLAILSGVVLLDSAAYDIARAVEGPGGGRAARLYENAFGPDRAVWRDASPLTHVAADKGIPPFLIFHAGRRAAGATLSREFAAALSAAGSPALAVHAADRDHAGINRCIGEPGDPYTRMVMAFLADPRGVEMQSRPRAATR